MKHLILANWKMAPNSLRIAKLLFDATKQSVARMRSVEVVLAPPAVYVEALARDYKGNKVSFCAQSISKYEDSAHTGSISILQYTSIGCEYCLVGHSEVGENLDDMRVKTFLALKHNVTPIVFVGEKERDIAGKYLQSIKEQIKTTLKELSISQIDNVVFCYEPVWAVGGAEALDIYSIHQMALYIRKILVKDYGASVARKVKVLYGGSVDSTNIADILNIEDIDGVAIGRFSTEADTFTELLRVANKV